GNVRADFVDLPQRQRTVAYREDLVVAFGEGQLHNFLDGDAVVRKENLCRHGGPGSEGHFSFGTPGPGSEAFVLSPLNLADGIRGCQEEGESAAPFTARSHGGALRGRCRPAGGRFRSDPGSTPGTYVLSDPVDHVLRGGPGREHGFHSGLP